MPRRRASGPRIALAAMVCAATSGALAVGVFVAPVSAAARSTVPGAVAGYDFTPGGVVTQGSMRFVLQPIGICNLGTDNQAVALGLGVQDVAGLPSSLAAVYLTCLGGQTYFELDAIADSQQGTSSANVTDGDSLVVSYVIRGQVLKMKIKDLTSGASAKAVGPAPSDMHLTFGAFPLFGETPLPPPTFGTQAFKGLHVNKQTPTPGTEVLISQAPHIAVAPLFFRPPGAKFNLVYYD